MAETTIDFITLRQPQRINEKVKRLRYIPDIRSDALAPVREQLKGADGIGQKIFIAQAFKVTPVFFTPDYYYTLKYGTIVDTLREFLVGPVVNRDGSVTPGVEIATIIGALEERLPIFVSSSYFTVPNLPPAVLGGVFLQYAAIFESLYCTTVLAGVLQQETNYLIDALRALNALAVLRKENLKTPPTERWPYYDFDAYEVMVDEKVLRYRNYA
jgi:hypothetical protein